MNWRQTLILTVIILFGAYSLVPVYQFGFAGVFREAFANSATTQVSLDLIIALSLICTWMWADASHNGWSPIPFIVVTVVAGSFGPLLYLLRRLGSPVRITLGRSRALPERRA
jgi:Terpene cyclase DEP1